VPFFGQEGDIHREPIVLKGLPKALPRNSPSGPRENHGSKTAGEAAFIPSGYRRLSLSFLNISFSLVAKFGIITKISFP